MSKKIILGLGAARSGTMFLAKLMELVPGVDSFHEPPPPVWKLLAFSRTNVFRTYMWLMSRKFPLIDQVMKDEGNTYFESNHMLLQGFIEPWLCTERIPDILIIRRNTREVCRSILQLDTIPGRTDKGKAYYLCPDDPCYLRLPGWENLTNFQIVYWYCLEMEYRIQLYKKWIEVCGGNTAEITLGELQDVSKFKKVLDDLGLGPMNNGQLEEYEKIKTIKVNQKKNWKQHAGTLTYRLPDSVEQEEDEVRAKVREALIS